MKSLFDEEKCFFCGRTYGLHTHHIFHGTALRKVSEKNGFTVRLCPQHHNLGGYGECVHQSHDMDIELKKECQRRFEKNHTRDEFMSLIGQNYLD